MINGRTQLVGIIGNPVGHSLSPAMHNAAARALGLNLAYVPLPVPPEGLALAVRALPLLGFLGVNVTVPYKQTARLLLDEVEAGAQAIGAINTIVVQRLDGGGTKLRGFNTDWSGFLADLDEQGVDVNGRDCVILGAGGSARAVVYGLLTRGARVQVLARRRAQAEQLTASLLPYAADGVLAAEALAQLPTVAAAAAAPLIVNTTPLGMSPIVDRSVWPDGVAFPDGAIAYDLVYNPAETRFMQQAQAAGCRAINGLGMLLHQGAVAFALWTGVQPDVAVMRGALARA